MCLGVPGQIVRIDNAGDRLATVDICGVRRQINISCIVDDEHPAEACVGDWVLIHVGFALSKVDEEEAHATLALLRQMGADYEQELEELKASLIE
jgi:hydrogenase expression/formation protein HypC